jgi:hypothetical protein
MRCCRAATDDAAANGCKTAPTQGERGCCAPRARRRDASRTDWENALAGSENAARALSVESRVERQHRATIYIGAKCDAGISSVKWINGPFDSCITVGVTELCNVLGASASRCSASCPLRLQSRARDPSAQAMHLLDFVGCMHVQGARSTRTRGGAALRSVSWGRSVGSQAKSRAARRARLRLETRPK